MSPTDKKKKVKKAPAYLTGESDLQPFEVKVGQLVNNALGQTGVVLGVKYEQLGQPGSAQLWVRWDGCKLEAPVDALNRFATQLPAAAAAAAAAADAAVQGSFTPPAVNGELGGSQQQQPGFHLCNPAQQLLRDAAGLASEHRVLAARWAAYDAEQAKAAAAAARAAARKKKKKEAEAAAIGGEQGAADAQAAQK